MSINGGKDHIWGTG